eukprot:scaffold157742_cov43-Prasinocladus_malaysianus.AAC.1
MEAVGLQAPKIQGKAKAGGKRGNPAKPKPTKTDGKVERSPKTQKRRKSSDCAASTSTGFESSPKRRSARRAHLVEENQLIWAKMKGQGYWPAQ